MLYRGEKYCVGRKIGVERLWDIYCKLLLDFQKRQLALHPPMLVVKPTKRGWCHSYASPPWFSLPAHYLDTCEEWVTYYIAHEMSHCAGGGLTHSPELCALESSLLEKFDIKIEYKGGCGKNQRWYPRRLIRISTGQTICLEKGRPA